MNAVSRLTAKELNLAARTVFAEAATEGLNGYKKNLRLSKSIKRKLTKIM